MAQTDFESTWEAYGELLEFLKARGCYFMYGMLAKEEWQICAQPRVQTESDVAPGNHLWYVFCDDWTVEPMGIRLVNNIHQGKMFSATIGCGGPYIHLSGFKRPDGSMTIDIAYQPYYLLSNGSLCKVPDAVKSLYKELQKFLKAKGCRKL